MLNNMHAKLVHKKAKVPCLKTLEKYETLKSTPRSRYIKWLKNSNLTRNSLNIRSGV